MTSARPGLIAALVAALVAVPVAGCGASDETEIEVKSGEMGFNADIGEIRLRAEHIEAPERSRYPKGADPRAWLTLINDGRGLDRLTSASSPDAERIDIRWDRECDGTAERVTELPLQPTAGTGSARVGALPFEPYYLQLVNLRREILAGTTIRLTLRFAGAGPLDTAALVMPSNGSFAEPSRACVPSPAPSR